MLLSDSVAIVAGVVKANDKGGSKQAQASKALSGDTICRSFGTIPRYVGARSALLTQDPH